MMMIKKKMNELNSRASL